MPVTITHSTPADGTFSATGAAAWDATHTVSGLGTMAEQNANNVNITGGSITGVTGVLSSLTVNSTPTSGGAVGQIMFDTGTVLQESSNLVWDNTNKKLTITGATVTTSQPVLDMTQTWNAAGTTFTGLKFNATDTASATASLLLDLQVGGSSIFRVRKDGYLVSSAAAFLFGTKFGLGQAAGAGQWPQVASDYGYAFSSTTSVGTGHDTYITRRAAANLRFGAADAAAPVAQTLSVQSVVAGTSNTAGANLTITGSQGTGTGAGGSIIFQVAPAGSSGTAQNALATALTIASDQTATFTSTVKVGANDAVFALGNGASSYFRNANINQIIAGSVLSSATALGLVNGVTSPADVLLTRRGAANLRFGAADAAAPVAQTLSVQSVVAGTTNTAGANLTITGSQGTGTGAGGSIIFQVAPAGGSGTAQNALSNAFTINSDRSASFSGNTNSAYAISAQNSSSGSSGETRFNLTNDANQVAGFTLFSSLFSNVNFRNQATFYSQNGFYFLTNNTVGTGGTGNMFFTAGGFNNTPTIIVTAGNPGLLAFAGTTSSFPALKRSTTILQVRLADDSAYAPVEASTVRTATAYTVATLPAAGTAGRRAYVTDATAPTFLGALIGGGTVVCPVFDDGTAWVAG